MKTTSKKHLGIFNPQGIQKPVQLWSREGILDLKLTAELSVIHVTPIYRHGRHKNDGVIDTCKKVPESWEIGVRVRVSSRRP